MNQGFNFVNLLRWITSMEAKASVDAPAVTLSVRKVERIIRTAITDFPDDPEPTAELSRRMLDRGDVEGALAVNEDRLARVQGDPKAIFTRLRCLLRLGRLAEANTVFQALPQNYQDGLMEEENATQFLKDMIDSGAFSKDDTDFGDVFFSGAFVRNARFIHRAIGNFHHRYQYEYLDEARAYVESCGAHFMYLSFDSLFESENKSAMEVDLLNAIKWLRPRQRGDWLNSKPPHVVAQYSDYPEYSDEYLKQIFSGPNTIFQATRTVLSNHNSEFLNVDNNLRRTVGTQPNPERRVVCLGGSDVYGFGSDDGRTFASYLQGLLNEQSGMRYRVENHGSRGNPLSLCVLNLFQTQINEGDVVMMYGFAKLSDDRPCLQDAEMHHLSFDRPHDFGEIFIDHNHLGPKGNKVVADWLLPLVLAKEGVKTEAADKPVGQSKSLDYIQYLIYRNSADVAEQGNLKKYVDYVATQKVETDGTIGSVAVNCNPMTLGHLHLLEYAAGQVDHLFVFVIEEDQSFFSFTHRLEMVKKGLAHLPHVTVLKGGQFICTQLTFPEYFSKDDVQEVKADASMEAWFFCEYVAKALNITKIFLGDEPKCLITRQYNAKMAEILPKYDISVTIIDRISKNGAPISASAVRKFLDQQDYTAISQIVPDTTLQYLVDEYGLVKAA